MSVEVDGFMALDCPLEVLKLLADESRLKLLAILENRPCSVDELASLLGLTPPTVSHHLDKCRKARLVNMEAEGNTHIYTLSDKAARDLEKIMAPKRLFKAARQAIDFASWDEKLLGDFLDRGRLTALPASRKKRFVILKWLACKFPEGDKFPEKRVNQVIGRYHEDFATVRRELVGYGLMKRRAGIYWRARLASRAANPHA